MSDALLPPLPERKILFRINNGNRADTTVYGYDINQALQIQRDAYAAGLAAQPKADAAGWQRWRDGLAGLYGLLQLISGRDDAPTWLRSREWEQNHRAIEARVLLAEFEQHSPEPK